MKLTNRLVFALHNPFLSPFSLLSSLFLSPVSVPFFSQLYCRMAQASGTPACNPYSPSTSSASSSAMQEKIVEALVVLGRQAFTKAHRRADRALHIPCDSPAPALGAVLLEGTPWADNVDG